MGEYFGSALAAGDINADGFDDLVVGSPTYRKSSYSEGCVHVFLGTQKVILSPFHSHINLLLAFKIC